MDKTANMLHREFSNALTSLINNCGLPAFVIKDTLRCALFQVEQIEDQEYQRDLKEYQELQEVEE